MESSDSTQLPRLGHRRWWQLSWALALAVVAAATQRPWPLVVSIAILAIAGPWAAAIDAGHHRLPNLLVLPAWAGTIVVCAMAALTTRSWRAFVLPTSYALVFGIFFLLISLIPASGLGMGDVKFIALLTQILGQISFGAGVAGLLCGLIAGGVYALYLMARHRASGSTSIALGPSLLAGSTVVLVLNAAQGLLG